MQAAARSSIRLLLLRLPPAFPVGTRPLSSSASAARSSPSYLDKEEVTNRVIGVLTSVPFIDPSKVNATADFKKDLQLDMLDNVEVMMAVEEEFAVEISTGEADKISNAAHLINYIAANSQAK